MTTKKSKPRIVVLDHEDPDQEFKMELAYLMSLTTQQRYKMMLDHSRTVMKRLIEIGYINPNEIVIRPAHSNRLYRKSAKKKRVEKANTRGVAIG